MANPMLSAVKRAFSRASGADQNADSQEFLAFGLLRDIRVHSQDLERSTGEIKATFSLSDSESRKKQLAEAIRNNQPAFDRNKTNVLDLLTRIRALFGERPDIYNRYGDEVSQVADLWERVLQNWPGEQETTDVVTNKLKAIELWLHEIGWHCGYVTIPTRVNEHLGGMRPGQTLDFNRTFSDELPQKKDRDEILKYLKDHPLDIEGITDAEQGMIYRVAHSSLARILSCICIIAFMAFGLVLVWINCSIDSWLPSSNWPVKASQLSSFLAAYIFVLLGSFLHVVIASFKQARSGGNQPFTALEDFVLWIHVKELAIMGGIFSVWFVLFGMAFFGKLPDIKTAFFVGYGIDSMVDVVLKRFDATVPKRAVEV